MRLYHDAGYYQDATVPPGKTAVAFVVEGGPAKCLVYRWDGRGTGWVLIGSKTVRTPSDLIAIGVSAGWWIRIQIEPLGRQKDVETMATVSFYPVR